MRGCQELIKREQPLAMYVYCSAHQLNLAISSACPLPEFKNMYGTISAVVEFVHKSAKRVAALSAIIEGPQETPSAKVQQDSVG